MNKAYLAVLIVSLLAGCASDPARERPQWLDGRDPRYPAVQYLSATGSAQDPERAEDRARGNLAEIFEARVEARSEDTRRFERYRQGEQSSVSEGEEITRRLAVSSDVVLKGVRIAERWTPPESNAHYALAVLSRPQSSASLRQEIRRLDGATEAVMADGARSDDRLRQAGAVIRALALQLERSGYQGMLQVVDPSGRGIAPEWNLGKLEVQLDSLLAGISVGAQAQEQRLRELVAGAVADAGFSDAAPGDTAEYLLVAAMDRYDVGQHDGWYWLRADLSLTLKRGPAGAIVGSETWPLKVAGLSPEAAEGRLWGAARETLRSDLREALIGFATAAR
jgi:hypothetical protein